VRVVLVHGLKGGVGKTATAASIAFLAARGGERTLLLDLDPQGAASFTFRVRPRGDRGVGWFRPDAQLHADILASDHQRLDLVAADASLQEVEDAFVALDNPGRRMRELLAPIRHLYDCAVLDCAPGFSRLNEAALDVSDLALLPTIPTPLSLRTLAQLMLHLKRRSGPRPDLLPFFCMVDSRKRLHRDVVAYVQENQLGFAEARVPYSSLVERMGSRRLPLPAYAPSSAPARAYESLWAEACDRRGRKGAGEGDSLLRKRARKQLEEVVRSTFREGG